MATASTVEKIERAYMILPSKNVMQFGRGKRAIYTATPSCVSNDSLFKCGYAAIAAMSAGLVCGRLRFVGRLSPHTHN